MPADLPTGTVTFLFTDIEGSTRLWSERPDEMSRALEQHDGIVRDAIETSDGYIFATGGDGFAAAFARVTDAIEAAAVAQLGLFGHEFLRVRMGVHTGEAQLRNDDYFGSAVNKAARIMASGHGGQTLMSSTTSTLVEGHPVKNLGEHRLRDLEGETVIWQLGTDDFDALRTLDQLPGNLPVQRTSFIGRVDEVKSIGDSVNNSRLVTLVGPGGVGKSRVALQVAAELSADYSGGAWFAPLGSLTEPNLVGSAVADSLGIGDRRGETAEEALAHWFATRDALLVIDNCEHLLDEVAAVVDLLLDVDSRSRVLATSQAPLAVPGEVVHVVEPLSGGGSAGESVLLFAERARAARSGFRLGPDNEDAVIEICDRLDHIPLAIELAASRTRAMSPADIAKRLDQRFRLLSSGDRGVPGRHRTLEAALRWSFELLDETQQVVLSRLSEFAAPFTLDAAEAVLADDGRVETWEVFDALLSLVDKSLVVARDHDDTTRYHLLESVRQFGAAELGEADSNACHRRLVDHYAAFVFNRGELLFGPRDQEALDDLDCEWSHVRVVLRDAVDDGASDRFDRLYEALGPAFLGRGRSSEGMLWGAEMIGTPFTDASLRLAGLGCAAVLTTNVAHSNVRPVLDEIDRVAEASGLTSPPIAIGTRALLAVTAGDNQHAGDLVDGLLPHIDFASPSGFGEAQAVTSVIAVLGLLGRHEGLREMVDQYRDYAERMGSAWLYSSANSSATPVAHVLYGDDALDLLTSWTHHAQEIHNEMVVCHCALFLGIHQLRSGDITGSAASLTTSLRAASEASPAYVGQTANAVVAISLRAWPRTATMLLGGLARWRESRSQSGTTIETDAEAKYVETLRRSLGPDFDDALTAGRAWTEREFIPSVQAVLAAIHAGTMTDDLLTTAD